MTKWQVYIKTGDFEDVGC